MNVERFCVIIVCLILFSCENNSKDKLTIATAANMQFVMQELTNSFTEKMNIECEVIVGSSGKLTAQIMQGAPFDLFVSANMTYPVDLYNNGFTKMKPKVYAFGSLVLWSTSIVEELSLEMLKSDDIKHIALANPRIAPYGISALEVLKNEGVYDKVKDKLVYGESISQTNQFINSKVVEIGFTAKSVVLSPNARAYDNWIEMNKESYSPIEQGVVILNNRKNFEMEAFKFYKYLSSPDGARILRKFGYTLDVSSK